MIDVPDVIVTAIQFGDEVINIQYAERRKQSQFGGVIESATYEVDYIEEDVEELQQNAVDLVDTILRLIRNPPPMKKGGEQMLREAAELIEEKVRDIED
jgi:hypothetical protein